MTSLLTQYSMLVNIIVEGRGGEARGVAVRGPREEGHTIYGTSGDLLRGTRSCGSVPAPAAAP